MARRMFACLLTFALVAIGAAKTAVPAFAFQPAAQGDFVPFTGVPPDQQMPAAPLLIPIPACLPGN